MQKEIKSEDCLKEEIENLYQRTDKNVLSEYLKNNSLIFTVGGCMDCPFSKTREIMDKNQERIIEHTFCILDKNKSSINSFIKQPNLSPIDCPLNDNNIEIVKK